MLKNLTFIPIFDQILIAIVKNRSNIWNTDGLKAPSDVTFLETIFLPGKFTIVNHAKIYNIS